MKVMFVGDVSLGEYYLSFGHGPRSFAESNDIFENVKEIFRAADIVVGNLEAPITYKNADSNDPEKMVLKANPDHAANLKEAGFRVLQVANNHAVQHGESGFDDTIRNLSALDILAVGLNNQDPVEIEVNGVRLGFLAASDVPDNTDVNQSRYQRLNDVFLAKITKEVANYDHLIVMLHWGLESSTEPLDYQRELAVKLKRAGVSAVIGSHPHLFYQVEYSPGFVCAYSLGNFVFDLCWDDRMMKSGILQVDFSREGVSGCVWPVQITQNGCLPTVVDKARVLKSSLTLYDHGKLMRLQQLRKIVYFCRNLHRGCSRLKLVFLGKKFKSNFKNSSKWIKKNR